MKRRELDHLLEKWRERLRLQAWDITLRYLNATEAENRWGMCTRDNHALTAEIGILDLRSSEWRTADRDPEVILIHELLHVSFAHFDLEDIARSTLEENAVNCLARLLVALDRSDESVMNGGRPLSRGAAIPA